MRTDSSRKLNNSFRTILQIYFLIFKAKVVVIFPKMAFHTNLKIGNWLSWQLLYRFDSFALFFNPPALKMLIKYFKFENLFLKQKLLYYFTFYDLFRYLSISNIETGFTQELLNQNIIWCLFCEPFLKEMLIRMTDLRKYCTWSIKQRAMYWQYHSTKNWYTWDMK